MKFIKGFFGFVIFAVGTFFLTSVILINLDFEPTRSFVILLFFLSIGMGRFGYALFTGHILIPNFSKSLNKNKLKNFLYKKK